MTQQSTSVSFAGLQDSPLFKGLTETELKVLESVFKPRRMGEGTTVFVENMAGESLYLIQQGTIKISKMLAEGDEQILVVLGPEDVFGEMAIFDGAHRSATARVAEEATLLGLFKKDFDALSEQHPRLGLKLALNIIRIFSSRIRSSQNDYRDMLLATLGRRE